MDGYPIPFIEQQSPGVPRCPAKFGSGPIANFIHIGSDIIILTQVDCDAFSFRKYAT